jgi:hypothetical protein
MRKISFLLFLVSLLSACSMTVDQILGRTPSPTPIALTNTTTPAPTFTPTVPSPTFTASPTMIVQTKKTPMPFESATQLILTQPGVTPLPSSTPIALVTPVKMVGFVSVTVSDAEFYKGRNCPPVSTKITAQVIDAANTAFVVLFVRFKSKQTGTTSEWTSIGMQPSGIPGFYTHDLVSTEMKADDVFKNAWVQYQIVATDSNSSQVGRTDIFDERLTLLECVATSTPDPSMSPTATSP